MKHSVALRNVAKRLSYRKRYLSLSSIEQIRLRRLKKLILVLLCKINGCGAELDKEDMHFKLKKLIMVYFALVTTEDERLDKCQDMIKPFKHFQQVIVS